MISLFNEDFDVIELALVCSVLTASIALNAFLGLKLRSIRKKPRETYDARALLHDLTGGAAYVEVKRIAPEQFFLRSPRDLG